MRDDAKLLQSYRRLHAERGFDWGREFALDAGDAARMLPGMFPELRIPLPPTITGIADLLWARAATNAETNAATNPAVISATNPGVVLVGIDSGGTPSLRRTAPFTLPNGATRQLVVVVRSSCERPLGLRWGHQRATVAARGAVAVQRLVRSQDRVPFTLGGTLLRLDDAIDRADAKQLRVEAESISLWAVRDAGGTAWFPQSAQPRWDTRGRGWFAADAADLHVPAGEYTIDCENRLGIRTRTVHIPASAASSPEDSQSAADAATTVRFDFTGSGSQQPRQQAHALTRWVEADLHVHRNYSGDCVVDLPEAQRIQDAAGLEAMALVAGNVHTSHVYDHSLIGAAAAPTPHGGLTLFGAEFRNNLYGHMVILGAAPPQLFSGHPHSDRPDDDVTPAMVGISARRAGGVAIMSHPFWGPLDDHLPDAGWEPGSGPDATLTPGSTPNHEAGSAAAQPQGQPASTERLRSVEAVYLPVAAVLGAIDAVELLSPGDTATTEWVVHRLFDAGLRFGLVAGSDSFLSFSSGPTAGPPGNTRCKLGVTVDAGQPVTERALLDALERKESLVSAGLEAEVRATSGGREVRLGSVARAGDPLQITVEVTSGHDAQWELRAAGGKRLPLNLDHGSVSLDVPGDFGTWVAVRATRDGDPDAYFHTTPIFLDSTDVEAKRCATVWALAWIERLRLRVEHHATGSEAALRPVFEELAAAAAAFATADRAGRGDPAADERR